MDEWESFLFQLEMANLRHTLYFLRTEGVIDGHCYLGFLVEIWNCREIETKRKIAERMKRIYKISHPWNLTKRHRRRGIPASISKRESIPQLKNERGRQAIKR